MNAACCTCNPIDCATDDTGDHCNSQSCGYCLHGCPAPDDEPCCLDGPSIITVLIPGVSL